MIFTPFAGGALTTTAGVGEFVMASGEDTNPTPPPVTGVGASAGITVSSIGIAL